MSAANEHMQIVGESEDFVNNLAEHLRAGYQVMYVPTSEMGRVEHCVGQAIARNGDDRTKLITWTAAFGFSNMLDDEKALKFRTPEIALAEIVNPQGKFKTGNYVFILNDLDDLFTSHIVRSQICTISSGAKLVSSEQKKPIIIVSALRSIHPKLRPHMAIIEFPLPDEVQMDAVFEYVQQSANTTNQTRVSCEPTLRRQCVQGLLGLSAMEAENALSRCLIVVGSYTPEMLSLIKDEKAAIIRKGEMLTYIPETQQADRSELGGFDGLTEFIDQRRLSYLPEARAAHLDYPKGIVLIGPPGTAKSVAAMSVARQLGLPGYIFDISAVFGSLVGQSEDRMREALRLVEAQKGSVLLIDEADKALGGTDAANDSGVSKRVMGQLLTWLATKQDRTFVIMTLNRTKGLPPELLRAGRFDAIFSTDLPTAQERLEIIKIHLRKRGVADPAVLGWTPADWTTLADKTDQFVGSELEQMVCEAKYLAFYARRGAGIPTLEEMMAAQAKIIPLSQLDPEGITAIREFCKNRARPVSKQSAGGVSVRERRARGSRAITLEGGEKASN